MGIKIPKEIGPVLNILCIPGNVQMSAIFPSPYTTENEWMQTAYCFPLLLPMCVSLSGFWFGSFGGWLEGQRGLRAVYASFRSC